MAIKQNSHGEHRSALGCAQWSKSCVMGTLWSRDETAKGMVQVYMAGHRDKGDSDLGMLHTPSLPETSADR